MGQDVIDIVVRVHNKVAWYRSQKIDHRLMNAFKNGVLTGLRLGEVPMRAGMSFERGRLSKLTDYSLSVEDAVKSANRLMPEKSAFDEDMFKKSGKYRTEPDTADYYAQGIEVGYVYVFNLVEAFTDPSSEVIARRAAVDHLKMVTRAIEEM